MLYNEENVSLRYGFGMDFMWMRNEDGIWIGLLSMVAPKP
jgi:hypothetical protein